MLHFLKNIESGTAKVVCHPEGQEDGNTPVTKTHLAPRICLLGDIIYVTGNHDEDSGELVYSYGVDTPDKSNPAYSIYPLFKGLHRKIESLKIKWNPDHILELSPRHYPATSTHGHVHGLNAGGVHYVFVHGQQFD